MEKVLTILTLLFSFVLFGQDYAKQIVPINTLEEAYNFITVHQEIDSQLVKMTPEIEKDKNLILFSTKSKGDIFSDEMYVYKIIDITEVNAFRVSYIYLNGEKLTIDLINKKRNKILREYKNGVTFSNLANKYTMDGSLNGDLDWFTEGMMVKEFEISIKEHNLNDIYTLDIPSMNWFYVVLKTFNDKKVKEFSVLRIKKL